MCFYGSRKSRRTKETDDLTKLEKTLENLFLLICETHFILQKT